jgi:hypothetical protein
MKNRIFGVLAIAVAVATLAAPLGAQSTRLTATVPFEFMVGSKTMPAGDYRISSASSAEALTIAGGEKESSALALTRPVGNDADHAGETVLVFHRYGDHYALSQIWDDSMKVAREIPMSRTEREMAKAAPVEKVTVLAYLAKR